MHSKNIFFVLIVMFASLTQFAADIYAPSLPAIAEAFNTSMDLSQSVMSVYMFGVAGSMLIYGPLSEGFGRKLPMILGLGIILVGNLVCMQAASIESLLLGKLIQGSGVGACGCLWRTTFRDFAKGADLAKYASYTAIATMLLIPSAFLFGGYLQQYFGWQAGFVFMDAYVIIALIILIFGFKETNINHHISRIKPKYILSQYWILLSSPIFMGGSLCIFLTYGAFFSWSVIGPVLLIDRLDIAPIHFGLISFCIAGLFYTMAGIINGKLVKKWGIRTMLYLGWLCMVFAGLSMILGYYLAGMNIWSIMFPLLFLFFGSTFIWPNILATAFTPFGHMAGYTGALYGFIQVSGAACVAAIAAYLPDDNQLILGIIITITSVLAMIIYELVVSKHCVIHRSRS